MKDERIESVADVVGVSGDMEKEEEGRVTGEETTVDVATSSDVMEDTLSNT